MGRNGSGQDNIYRDAAASYGAALGRLARAYEADADKRRDLTQEIHFALWRSFAVFDARCSVRTWVYRVAHNVAASYVARQRRILPTVLVSLEEVDAMADPNPSGPGADRQVALDRLLDLIHRLRPLDRQVILSYLEGLDAAAIGEITGISPGNAATKIHRIKAVLARQFHQGGPHAD